MNFINYILRKISESLSIFWINPPIKNLNQEKKIYEIINRQFIKINVNKKVLKETHLIFNYKIKNIIKKKNLKNLLRYPFVQKIFFVHNRFFIIRELLKLKLSVNWNLYKKLLKENSICNPVRYFLYPSSSGNRIHQIYHLYILEHNTNALIKNFSKIFELGGGYGCLASIFQKLNKNNKMFYEIVDTKIVNLVQFYYLKMLNFNVGFNKNFKIKLTNNINQKFKTYDLFVANWSLSEVPIKYRNKFFNIIKNSKYFLISFQENFEDIDNLKYFCNLKNKLKNNFKIKIIRNRLYKGSIIKKQKHFYMVGENMKYVQK
tara:strand:- start:12546 stop:13499 length:954 start_codon:yes stop_codon:yes gene_type:complete